MKINYPHYQSFGSLYPKEMEQIVRAMEEYTKILNECTLSGLASGRIHDELVIFSKHVSRIPEMIQDISERMKTFVPEYLNDMNDAQRVRGKYILYPADYQETRDYSDQAFEEMLYLCDSTNHDANVFEEINDWGENLVSGVIGFLGKTFGWFNAKQTQILVMEKNDITKKRLKEIQQRLKTRESSYKAKLLCLQQSITELHEYVILLSKAMCSDVAGFSMDGFNPKLDAIYSDVKAKLNSISFDKTEVDAEVIAFINSVFAYKLFKTGSDIIKIFMEDLSVTTAGDADYWKICITQMFDISKHDIMQGFNEDYTYTDYLMDKNMLETINDVTQTETFDDGKEKKFLDTYKNWMGYIEKFGDNWEKELEGQRDEFGNLILDKRTKEYKVFKENFDQFGRAEDILKYGTDFCQIIAMLVADYEKNIVVLDALERNYDASDAMAASLKRIRDEYEKSITSIAIEIKDKILKYGVEHVTKNFDKLFNVSIFAVVHGIEKAIDAGGKVTGISEEAEAMTELLSSGYAQLSSAEIAYNNAVEKLSACPPDSEEYETCMQDFRVCFDYYKKTQKQLFDRMAKASTGVEGEYYAYCAEEIDDLTIKNSGTFKLKTLDEYKAM